MRRSAIDSSSASADDLVYIRFVLPADDLPPDIDEARLRLMIRRHTHRHQRGHQRHRSPEPPVAHVSVHQVVDNPSDTSDLHLQLLSRRSIFLGHADATHATHQYIDLDVSDAVSAWLLDPATNLGLQLQCEGCAAHELHIVHRDDMASGEQEPNSDDQHATSAAPELFVVGRSDPDSTRRSKRSGGLHRHYKANGSGSTGGHRDHRGGRVARRTECANNNKRCCRHRLDVVFKEVQGFEFIMQPLRFDAGYCHGRCPPRYNPAHHHALLQSMMWLQDPKRVSRPCCAASKLEPLEVLHADEMDATKMKVSTWMDMRVLECACS